MDYYQIIAGNFQDTMERISLAVDELATPLEQASQLMVDALLADRKIIACGIGPDHALAQLFCASLLYHREQERPPLPALTLGMNSVAVAGEGHDQGCSRELRALGQEGDVLLCICSATGDRGMAITAAAARERNMGRVLLSNSGNEALLAAAGAGALQLAVPSGRPTGVTELHTMVLHCLCDLIDQSLFGNY